MNCHICDSSKQLIILKHKNDRFIKKLACPMIQYVLCQKCGLAFQNPQPERELLARFYQEGEFEIDMSEKYFRASKKDAQQKSFWLKKYYGEGQGKKVLEIGSSAGILLDELRNDGWIVFGIEPSVSFSAYSRNYFGMNIQTGFLDEATFAGERFDVIIALHVLEHVTDPIRFLRIIGSKLAQNGVLFLEVPNIFGMRSDRSVVDYFCSIHMMMFTPKTITGLLGKAIFNVIELDVTERGISILATPNGAYTFDPEDINNILSTLKKHRWKHWVYVLLRKIRTVVSYLKDT